MNPLTFSGLFTRALRWPVFLGLALACVAALANFGLLFLSGWLLAGAACAGAAGLAAQQAFNMMLPATGVRFFATLRIVTRYLERLVTHDASLRLTGRMRVWVYTKLAPQAPAGLTDKRGGDLLSRFVSDTDCVGQSYTETFIPFARAILCGLVFALISGLFLKSAGLVLALGLLVCILPIPMSVGLFSAPRLRALTTQRGTFQADLADTLAGLGEYLTLGASEARIEALDTHQKTLQATERHLAALESGARRLMTFIGLLTALYVVMLAVQGFHQGALSAPEIPMLALGCLAAFDVTQPLPAACQAFTRARIAAERLQASCNAAPCVPAPTAPTPALHHPLDLIVRDISFRYPNTRHWVLEHASFTIHQGERVALVGASGIGKSSLISLLSRFYPYQGGEITLGGQDLRQFSTEDLAKTISVAAQDFHLFNGTIRDTLRLADSDADDAQMAEALRPVQLEEFVQHAPHGLDTLIGDEGLALSGGQARRLVLAQTLLRNTPWLILDEPTEGLDQKTEYALMQGLISARPDATILCITHRRTLIPFMDRILTLAGGQICPAEEVP
ncbi:ATP-binding CydC [Acetobacter malorum DSM 14337]|uniref:ATP-binding CydC n=1 Tax=Acetobacter malorum DSM 14337 TaxID=1307910 RepID=A0ABQ0PQZ2_9PROT|nr:thiol reductant ABC exporter subunit CydC [Acetobacter malorum]KXV08200.1 ATP-binding protein [Acetobacter malorum]GBQ76309.1 ATP-binding CydC [Acetobacter malorum DSM 14337]